MLAKSTSEQMKKLSPVLLLLIFVVAGCKLPASLKDLVSGGGEGGSGSSSGRSAMGGADPREDVVQASKKFIDLPFFTANMEGVARPRLNRKLPMRLLIAFRSSILVEPVGG